MSIFITKIKLYNFRRFREFVIEPNTKNNILIGDNESGKSTILEAIDLVSGGNNRSLWDTCATVYNPIFLLYPLVQSV